MARSWRDIPSMLATPIGRLQLRRAMHRQLWFFWSTLARLHRATLARNCRLVAVVGSFGKSTTARATAAALGLDAGRLPRGNAWSQVARAVLRIRRGDRFAVVEVGIDGPGQMARYTRVLRPNVTIVTSIGSEHNRSLGSLTVTRAEKAAMVRALPADGVAVLNGDDPNVLWMASQTGARVVTFGFGEANDVRASDVVLDWPAGSCFTLLAAGQRRQATLRLIGRHMVLSALAALAAADSCGVSLDDALQALAGLRPTPGRMDPVRLASGAVLLRDDFKSSLETVDAALDALAEIPARRRIVVLGEVSEPPGPQGPIYQRIGARVAELAVRAVFVGGNYQRYRVGAIRGGLPAAAIVNAGRSIEAAAEAAGRDLAAGDVVLIKGRDTERLERVALALMGHTVRCVVSVCDARGVACADCPMLARGRPMAT